MLKEFICEVCKHKYTFRVSKNRLSSRFCSNECKNKKVGSWVKGNPLGFNWETASEEEKNDRLNINFENLVIRKTGCWGWKGDTDSRRGYGRVVYLARNKSIPAHVASWKIHRGDVPKKMCVLHKCDNRSCTNPDHLFLGTNYENVRDMVYKDRQAKGSRCGNSKLKEDQVSEIKKMLLSGKDKVEISKLFNVTKECIHHIKIGKTWKHVEESHACQ